MTDQLPPFLKLIFFPGSYNKTDNKIEWTIDELNAGHSQEFLIRAKSDFFHIYDLSQVIFVCFITLDL